jgi:hypothetical protein
MINIFQKNKKNLKPVFLLFLLPLFYFIKDWDIKLKLIVYAFLLLIGLYLLIVKKNTETVGNRYSSLITLFLLS